MAHLSQQNAIDWVSVQQLINDWAYELDANEGLAIGDLVTENCHYVVRAVPRTSRADVEAFYRARLGEFPDGPPTQRHVVSNIRVAFDGEVAAKVTFTLVYFTTAIAAAGADPADPCAVADVWMDVARAADGRWRIARFDSNQVIVRKLG